VTDYNNLTHGQTCLRKILNELHDFEVIVNVVNHADTMMDPILVVHTACVKGLKSPLRA